MKPTLIASMIISFLAILGCATGMKTYIIDLSADFDRAQAQKQVAPGKNKVEGNAFMRQMGGGIVTCAGSEVMMTPATEYARQRIVTLYGNDKTGFTGPKPFQFSPDYPEYHDLTLKTMCNSQGNFEFNNVADGDFYLHTYVQWAVAGQLQGGYLMQKISLNGGKTGQSEKVILSR